MLRRMQSGDAVLIFNSYASDPEVARYMVWPVAKYAQDLDRFVSVNIAAFDAGTAYEYVVELKETCSIIGGCGVRRAHPQSDDHYIFGYCFARSMWGRGFATETTETVTDWFKNNPSIYRLAAHVDIDNKPSCRVLEKNGFTREGILHRWEVHPTISPEPRDCFSYSMVR